MASAGSRLGQPRGQRTAAAASAAWRFVPLDGFFLSLRVKVLNSAKHCQKWG